MGNFKIITTSEKKIGTDYNFQGEIVWKNAMGFLILHMAALYGLFLYSYVKTATIVWMLFLSVSSAQGIALAAHRLYCHKSFQATFSVRLILLILQTISGQNSVYIWVRDHRQHHKFSDTDADPYNARRGFFFSHIGWLMMKKHPAVKETVKLIDMSDLEADFLVMFQQRFYTQLYAVLAVAAPVATPVFLWNETWLHSFLFAYVLRYITVLNLACLVNSASHLYGTKPFDMSIMAKESPLSCLTFGEGWQNYHHCFPFDYRAAEFGSRFCFTTFIIDLLAHFGLAYDLKTAPYTMTSRRAVMAGDGTHHVFGYKKIISPILNGDFFEAVNESLDENNYNTELKKKI